MLSEHFFNLAFELPVFVGLERVIVQSAKRDAEFSSPECLLSLLFLGFRQLECELTDQLQKLGILSLQFDDF